MKAEALRVPAKWKSLLLILAVFGAGGLAAGAPAPPINGLWMHPYEITRPELVEKLFDQAGRAGMNNVYVLIFHTERAWFRTPQVPIADGVQEGFDPLAACIEAGHRRGIKVHAWFVNGSGKEGGAILSQHPDWRAVNAVGKPERWFDFANPEVRRFQRELMLSVVRQYPQLDGIHFDYIRYSDQSLTYSPAALEGFHRDTGLTVGGSAFPLAMAVSANPVTKPTTARTLAAFETGLPAILENRLGEGRVLFFNWHAELSPARVLDGFLAAKLKGMGAGTRRVRLLYSEANLKKYGPRLRNAGGEWLARLGLKATDAELGERDPAPDEILVVVSNYLWQPAEAARLRGLVEKGLNVVWVDGPASALPDLLAVLGVQEMGSFLTGSHTISPTVSDPALPVTREADGTVVSLDDPRWRQWRMDQVTQIVREVYQGAKAIRPGIEVTAAVFHGKTSADAVLQDWPRWVREGIIDYVIPMAYVGDAPLEKAFDEWQQLPEWRDRVVPGLSFYQSTDGKVSCKPADAVQRQLEICRRRGARGLVVFCCHYISPEIEPLLRAAGTP